MKIAIAGAGAIGAYLGAKLVQAGFDVYFIARGPHLEAMKKNGLKIIDRGGETFTVDVNAFSNSSEIGPVDLVFLTLKAHSLSSYVPSQLDSLLGSDTTVVTALNGLPWWYFMNHGGEYEGRNIERLDPDGKISKILDPSRIIGSVVYLATIIDQPGIIRFQEGDRFTLGELDGSDSFRVNSIAEAISVAGMRARVNKNIRQEIWVKLLGNLAFNPLSVITRSTLYDMATHEGIVDIARSAMLEATKIANELGIRIPISIEKRIEGVKSVGHHKTSMLQDLESGRPIELEAMLGSVEELGEILNIKTPYISALYSCTDLLTKHKGN